MSVGSFGWWGGFLSGGEVIYYNPPVWQQHANIEELSLARISSTSVESPRIEMTVYTN